MARFFLSAIAAFGFYVGIWGMITERFADNVFELKLRYVGTQNTGKVTDFKMIRERCDELLERLDTYPKMFSNRLYKEYIELNKIRNSATKKIVGNLYHN